MDDQILAAAKAAVEAIEKEMQPEEFLAELKTYKIQTEGEFAKPIYSAKMKAYADALLAEVEPAIAAATNADERWGIARAARDAFRAKQKALEPEMLEEVRARDAACREAYTQWWENLYQKPAPWRIQASAAALGNSVPDSIVTPQAEIEEVF